MATRYDKDWTQGPDSDGDGLSDAFEESVLHTDPRRRDTDGDGLSDLREKDFGSNPHERDTDGDGVHDGREVRIGTAPTLDDTDGDGIDDRTEIRRGTAHAPDRDRDGDPDWVEDGRQTDTDGDGLHDAEEQWLGTNVFSDNSDRDNHDDFLEVVLGGELHRDPNVYDTPPGGIGDPPPEDATGAADVVVPAEVVDEGVDDPTGGAPGSGAATGEAPATAEPATDEVAPAPPAAPFEPAEVTFPAPDADAVVVVDDGAGSTDLLAETDAAADAVEADLAFEPDTFA